MFASCGNYTFYSFHMAAQDTPHLGPLKNYDLQEMLYCFYSFLTTDTRISEGGQKNCYHFCSTYLYKPCPSITKTNIKKKKQNTKQKPKQQNHCKHLTWKHPYKLSTISNYYFFFPSLLKYLTCTFISLWLGENQQCLQVHYLLAIYS